MKLTVLMDNHTYIDEYYLGEPAVSYLIEDGERTILSMSAIRRRSSKTRGVWRSTSVA